MPTQNQPQPNFDSETRSSLSHVMEETHELQEKGVKIQIQHGEPKNRAKFSQIIIENIHTLVNKYPDYLTNSEFSMLFKLCSLTCKTFNKLVEYKNRTGYGYKSTLQNASITHIAEFINMSRQTVSKNINNLIKKGIIIEFNNQQENEQKNKEERPLFINPEISYRGSRNYIYGKLVRNVIDNDILEKNKIHLSWKAWISSNAQFGKLIRKRTYMKKKSDSGK